MFKCVFALIAKKQSCKHGLNIKKGWKTKYTAQVYPELVISEPFCFWSFRNHLAVHLTSGSS